MLYQREKFASSVCGARGAELSAEESIDVLCLAAPRVPKKAFVDSPEGLSEKVSEDEATVEARLGVKDFQVPDFLQGLTEPAGGARQRSSRPQLLPLSAAGKV